MKVNVCYTPELINQFDVSDKSVVVIDILRATSCMVAGLGSGVKSIIPVATVEECEALGKEGFVMAGERNGKKLDQFDIGNSPFDYMNPKLKGKNIATTTTNGTKAIELSKSAQEVLIGAFLNLSAITQHLKAQQRDTLLFCAGWKGRYNLEDSLFAGAVCDGLKGTAEFASDATKSAFYLYQSMGGDLFQAISQSDHAVRLSKFGIMKDIEFCSKKDEFNIVPKLIDERLTV